MNIFSDIFDLKYWVMKAPILFLVCVGFSYYFIDTIFFWLLCPELQFSLHLMVSVPVVVIVIDISTLSVGKCKSIFIEVT